jgi:hypothetical protein
LHSGKDFAVSAGLNRVVSARTSMVTHDRRYLLPFCEIAHVLHLTMNVRTFLPDVTSEQLSDTSAIVC